MRFPGSGEGGGGAGSAGSAGPALTETWASESSPFSADGCSLPCFELRPGQAGGGRAEGARVTQSTGLVAPLGCVSNAPHLDSGLPAVDPLLLPAQQRINLCQTF